MNKDTGLGMGAIFHDNGPINGRRRELILERMMAKDPGPTHAFEVDRTKPAEDEDMALTFSQEAMNRLFDEVDCFIASRIMWHFRENDGKGAKKMTVVVSVVTE